jgi:hypothetical protein
VADLTIGEEETTKLMAITRSRTETASRVERARMLLAYRDDPSFFAVGRALGVHNQTVRRCVERAVVFGPLWRSAARKVVVFQWPRGTCATSLLPLSHRP